MPIQIVEVVKLLMYFQFCGCDWFSDASPPVFYEHAQTQSEILGCLIKLTSFIVQINLICQGQTLQIETLVS